MAVAGEAIVRSWPPTRSSRSNRHFARKGMENSLFFNHILRGLGFRAYTVGVRIRHRTDGVPQGDYIGWLV